MVVGTPVTFFARGGGESPMTFMVASSPALLSSPDIDGGLGTRCRLDTNLNSCRLKTILNTGSRRARRVPRPGRSIGPPPSPATCVIAMNHL